jgi:hypothetical protein
METPKYDVIIPVSPKDFDILPYCLKGIPFLSPAPEALFIVCPVRQPVVEILKGVNIQATVVTDKEILDFSGDGYKPGWFQQVIKLFQPVTRDDYLVWDADLVLSKEFDIFGIEGRPVLRYHFREGETNVNKDYNAFMLEAFGQEPAIHMTMVCHHMFFRRSLLRQMVACFLGRHPKPDNRSDARWFYDWLLAKGKEYEPYVSEYEAYANYVLEKHPADYEVQRAAMIDIVFMGKNRTRKFVESYLAQTNSVMTAFHRRDDSLSHEWVEGVGVHSRINQRRVALPE